MLRQLASVTSACCSGEAHLCNGHELVHDAWVEVHCPDLIRHERPAWVAAGGVRGWGRRRLLCMVRGVRGVRVVVRVVACRACLGHNDLCHSLLLHLQLLQPPASSYTHRRQSDSAVAPPCACATA